MKIKSSPSKFGSGVSLLWNGISFETINKFVYELIFSSNEALIRNIDSNVFLFESARSAIFNSLVSQNIGRGDEVIVSAFTCEAVTYAVQRSGAKVVYIDINEDLTMNDQHLLKAINDSTKAVILQNTLGLIGLRIDTIEIIKQSNILLIEDCALSIGSKEKGVPHGTIGDLCIWSLEVSKTVTIGWGGVAVVNNDTMLDDFRSRYNDLGQVPFILDMRRIFQVWLSLLMKNINIPGAYLFWYFLYGSRIFRKSNNFNNKHFARNEKMGKISQLLYSYIQENLDEMFFQTNKNYMNFYNLSKELELTTTHKIEIDKHIVSPRFSLLLNVKNVDKVIKQGANIGIEVGRWFDVAPPKLGIKHTKIYSFSNAKKISESIINIPCHWTLDKKDKTRIKELLLFVSKLQ